MLTRKKYIWWNGNSTNLWFSKVSCNFFFDNHKFVNYLFVLCETEFHCTNLYLWSTSYKFVLVTCSWWNRAQIIPPSKPNKQTKQKSPFSIEIDAEEPSPKPVPKRAQLHNDDENSTDTTHTPSLQKDKQATELVKHLAIGMFSLTIMDSYVIQCRDRARDNAKVVVKIIWSNEIM